jgi:uncharacterized membrane protein
MDQVQTKRRLSLTAKGFLLAVVLGAAACAPMDEKPPIATPPCGQPPAAERPAPMDAPGPGMMGPQGMMMGHPGMMMAPAAPMPPLEEARMDAVRNAMKTAMMSDKKALEKLPGLFKRRAGILNAETFDTHAFLAVEKEIAKIHMQIMDTKAKAFAKLAAEATPDERKKLAVMMMQGPMGHQGRPPMPMMLREQKGPGPHDRDAVEKGPQGPQPPRPGEVKAPVEDAKPLAPSDEE